jgi:hypothetical protein
MKGFVTAFVYWKRAIPMAGGGRAGLRRFLLGKLGYGGGLNVGSIRVFAGLGEVRDHLREEYGTWYSAGPAKLGERCKVYEVSGTGPPRLLEMDDLIDL